MPITKAAKKALRQNERRRARNNLYRKKMRAQIKELRSLVEEKKMDKAKEMMPGIYKIIDKSAKVGIIKKNTASRKKSRLSSLIKKNS